MTKPVDSMIWDFEAAVACRRALQDIGDLKVAASARRPANIPAHLGKVVVIQIAYLDAAGEGEFMRECALPIDLAARLIDVMEEECEARSAYLDEWADSLSYRQSDD